MIDAPTKSSTQPATILIVDGHPAVREGLAGRISRLTDLEVCGETGDGAEALEFVSRTLPDVAIIDIAVRPGGGIDLIRRLKERHPSLHVLVWSMCADSCYAERALRAGAEGYINKDQATDHVVAAIRRILAGKIYLSELMADRLLRRSISGVRQTPGATPPEKLSDRELEAYRLIGAGLSTKEVARQMNAHLRTVETYLARIKRKFHFASRQQLVHAATQWALENR